MARTAVVLGLALLLSARPASAEGPPPDQGSGDVEAEAEPESQPAPKAEAAAEPKAGAKPERWKGPVRIVGWVALGVAGALALSSVGAFAAEAHYAGLYNDDSRCLVDGKYRFTVCNTEYNNAIQMDSLGITLAIAAGAAGITSAVMLLATRSEAPRRSRRPPSVSLGAGPGAVGLSLSGSF